MYTRVIRPLLFRLPADEVHELTIHFGEWLSHSTLGGALLSGYRQVMPGESTPVGDQRLSQTLFGLEFRNPIGLAAGFDKNGVLLPLMQALGFGFTEIGSITAHASKGNPKPRAFRLPDDESLINRMGLNNEGAERIITRLLDRELDRSNRALPLGVNIAKTHDPSILGDAAIRDYATSFEWACRAADYITVNVSCPNTAEGKTFEDTGALTELLSALLSNTTPFRLHSAMGNAPGQSHRASSPPSETDAPHSRSQPPSRPPVFVKFSVDLDQKRVASLLEVTEQAGIDGYVATNTSVQRTNLKTPESHWRSIGSGGLSGQAIRDRSTQVIQWIHTETSGRKPIIGIGGIRSAEDVMDKVAAGADLVQLYTALIYEGPLLATHICRNLLRQMEKQGASSWTEFASQLRDSRSANNALSEG